ncbi:MAG: addiction module antitoxin RelB [Acidobacteria bacterium]|nr:MAG: addiction module antitoxin RelB [Acidobacteriota bacterium]
MRCEPFSRFVLASAAYERDAALAKRLLDSLENISPEEHEKLWVEEAARRYEELKSGTARGMPAEEVFAKLARRNRE